VGKTGAAAIRAMIERDIAPLLIGEDPQRTEYLWGKTWWATHYVGRGGVAAFAISAVDIALWDLKARLAGEPWWRYFGGHSPRVKVYAGGIAITLMLAAVVVAAYVFRYRRLDPRLRPGRFYDVMLWLSFLAIAGVGPRAVATLF